MQNTLTVYAGLPGIGQGLLPGRPLESPAAGVVVFLVLPEVDGPAAGKFAPLELEGLVQQLDALLGVGHAEEAPPGRARHSRREHGELPFPARGRNEHFPIGKFPDSRMEGVWRGR